MEAISENAQTMADQKVTLHTILHKIAKERGYVNYKLNVKPITTGGANYSCVLFLATIAENDKDDIKLFNKVACVGEKVRAMSPFQIFESEICFYNELIKIYREIEEKHGVPEQERFVTPKFYGFSDEYLHETLVMEDLTASGYEMFDRFKTFDFNYAKEAVRQLAKLHALSIAFSIESPDEFEEKTAKLTMKNNMDSLSGVIEGMLKKVMLSLREEFKDRVQLFLKETMTVEKMNYLTKPHRRMVLGHGDFRASNIMHKMNEDGTYKVIIIDYQTLHRTNPILDLVYLIFNGTDQAFRSEYLQKTIDHYYTELTASLKLFHINPDEVYSREDFDYDYKEVLPYGLIISFMLLLLVTVDTENAPTMTPDSDFESFNMAPSEEYKKRVNELVEDFIKYGIL
ncbi:uncharacterized protein LOC125057440 [Pieris napi]|uniref:uncharacterized protein LOC125057440 n=1 Tax=Pieris napi TaxID=78633 RepID=UPI001FB8EC05|nr:uncharacterized protein LOC125057440 [Pieris napi]